MSVLSLCLCLSMRLYLYLPLRLRLHLRLHLLILLRNYLLRRLLATRVLRGKITVIRHCKVLRICLRLVGRMRCTVWLRLGLATLSFKFTTVLARLLVVRRYIGVLLLCERVIESFNAFLFIFLRRFRVVKVLIWLCF